MLNELLSEIRENAGPQGWSKGVHLARTEGVIGVSAKDSEVELSVKDPRGSARRVFLYIDDVDWSCDCNSVEGACEHAAAAVIALNKARRDGESLPGSTAQSPGRILHELYTQNNFLCIRRWQIKGDEKSPVSGSIVASQQRGHLMVNDIDLRVDTMLLRFGDGPLPQASIPKLFKALEQLDSLELDGAAVRLGDATTGLAVVLEDAADGVRARIDRDPAVTKLYTNGALRTADTLCPLKDHGLNRRNYEALREGIFFTPSEFGTLAGGKIPQWEDRFTIITRTARLPRRGQAKARLAIETQRRGDELEVMATVVYGEPAIARLDGERLILLNQGAAAPSRDRVREQRLIRHAKHDLGLDIGIRARFSTADAIAFTEQRLPNARAALEGSGHQDFYDAGNLTPAFDFGAFEDALWFEAESDSDSETEGARVSASAAVKSFEAGRSVVALEGGGFGKLPTQWMNQHVDSLRALLRAREAAEAHGSMPAWGLLEQKRLADSLGAALPSWNAKLDALRQMAWPEGHFSAPADLSANLREYQQIGVDWLASLKALKLGAVLADDMGLGKTLQTICVLEKPALVVVPTSLIHNWVSEISKFRPGLKTHVYHGASRQLDDTADVTVTSYGLLRADGDQLRAQPWQQIVLDEAHTIKNPDSQVAKAAFSMRAPFKIALTGTPVENRLEDLWSQMHFANPGLLGSRDDFAQAYAKPLALGDEGVAARLRDKIKPVLLRRTKKEVAPELPPRTDVNHRVVLSESERTVYEAILASTRADFVSKATGTKKNDTLQLLEALLRLRQAACDVALVPGQAEFARQHSSKVRLLHEKLEELVSEGHKALVFSQWTGFLDRIQGALGPMPHCRLDGSTRDRGAVIDAFCADDGPPVMLISLKAGGVGLNLTAADHVFLCDPWWNPAVEDQAADRAHRIGQDKPVFVHRLIAEETVEEGIVALQAEKRALYDAAVGDASRAQSLSRDDLLALLN